MSYFVDVQTKLIWVFLLPLKLFLFGDCSSDTACCRCVINVGKCLEQAAFSFGLTTCNYSAHMYLTDDNSSLNERLVFSSDDDTRPLCSKRCYYYASETKARHEFRRTRMHSGYFETITKTTTCHGEVALWQSRDLIACLMSLEIL